MKFRRDKLFLSATWGGGSSVSILKNFGINTGRIIFDYNEC